MNSLLNSVSNWRPGAPFYYGWLILAISFLAAFAASGVTQVVLGGIQVFITDDTGWKASNISIAVTAGTWTSGLLAPFIGHLADRHGPRWLMSIGLVIAAISFFSIAGTQAIWQFFAAYIVGRAISNPVLVGVVPRTAAVNFFFRRRNMALALISTFRPISGAINIQIISFIAIHWGWRAAYRYMGILSLILIAPVFLLMRRRPEDIGLLPDGAGPSQVASQAEGVQTGRAGLRRAGQAGEYEFSWSVGEALRTRTFWFVVLTAATATLASSTIGFSLVPYLADDVGLSKAQSAGVLSLGTFLAIGNLGWGYLADLITPRKCLAIAMVAAGATALFLTAVNSLPTAFVFALVFGVVSGPAGSLESMMLAQYYGRNSYGTILGAFAPFQTAMLGLGPALGALFREQVGPYTTLYFALAGLYFLAATFVFLAKTPRLPARATPEPLK
ncbi:MAG: hypothetical protein BZY81_07830 [SAR202 cluster bacterium Io17-Chloro-G4]|nr:MAG: hypothetical protein BZY81_07830 [SAR202 cluster bacterium Io17-Chloro-G4]